MLKLADQTNAPPDQAVGPLAGATLMPVGKRVARFAKLDPLGACAAVVNTKSPYLARATNVNLRSALGQPFQIAVANLGVISLFLVLSFSLSLNVILGWKVRVAGVHRPGLKINAVLPSLPVRDSNGARTWITFDNHKPSILYIVSPTCSWCIRNEGPAGALAAAVSSDYRFVTLTVKKGYSSNSPFRVFLMDSPELVERFGFSEVTPQTVVVSPGGTIDKVWRGAYLDPQRGELERYFNVHIPEWQLLDPPGAKIGVISK